MFWTYLLLSGQQYMDELNWARMPTTRLKDGKLASLFSANNNIATNIAALKVYICLCLFSEVEKVEIIVDKNLFGISLPIEKLRLTTSLTYEQLCERCSLSRALVSAALKKLSKMELILIGGTTRKKKYIINAEVRVGWCKLPKKALLGEGRKITAFQCFSNRSRRELDALKLFIYLLSIRPNDSEFIEVTKGIISERTGISLRNVDQAVNFLQSAELLDLVEVAGTSYKNSNFHSDAGIVKRFFIIKHYLLVNRANRDSHAVY
ncbi:hypothetical protein KUV89_17705 [Marinobacter hydrocarbonoclasticus]|nr:hypothetical protein [Marinobacter nauticus]